MSCKLHVGYSRTFWIAIFGLAFSCFGMGSANARDPAKYPERIITVVCPWATGGGTDQVSRFIADQLQERLGSPVIVVNKEGGSGAIGHEAVANADADGYTIGMITAELSTMHNMGICDKTYRDYQCLMQVNADAAAIIVKRDAPWQDLPALLEEIRQRPGELKMSGTATGGLWDLARAGMLKAAGLEVSSVIWVPTKGSAPSLLQLLGGHIDVVCCSVPEVSPQLEANDVRVLAVLSEERLADFPDLPTANEQGLNWVAMGWRGLALPKGTPPVIVGRLETELQAILTSAEYRDFMKLRGFGVEVKGSREFEDFLDRQETQWKQVLEDAGYMLNNNQDTHLDNSDPGPYALPIALGVMLGLGLLLQLGSWWSSEAKLQGAPHKNQSVASKPNTLNVVVLIASLAAYLLLLPWAGFSITTVVFASGLIGWFGSRVGTGIMAGVILTALVRLVFVVLFKVPLPDGHLGLPF